MGELGHTCGSNDTVCPLCSWEHPDCYDGSRATVLALAIGVDVESTPDQVKQAYLAHGWSIESFDEIWTRDKYWWRPIVTGYVEVALRGSKLVLEGHDIVYH